MSETQKNERGEGETISPIHDSGSRFKRAPEPLTEIIAPTTEKGKYHLPGRPNVIRNLFPADPRARLDDIRKSLSSISSRPPALKTGHGQGLERGQETGHGL
ncbi:hypothetical protein PCK1_001029, partial [Pneumocystis canis]